MASTKFTQFAQASNTSETEISVGVKGGSNFKRLNNMTATTAPTVNDDGSDGYTVGSTWFDTITGTLYVCKDSTNGAAVWAEMQSKQYNEVAILYYSADGSDNGTATILNPSGWYGTLTITRAANQIFVVSDSTPFTPQKTVFQCNFVGDDSSVGLFYNAQTGDGTGTTISVLNYDTTSYTGALGDGNNLLCSIVIRVYP